MFLCRNKKTIHLISTLILTYESTLNNSHLLPKGASSLITQNVVLLYIMWPASSKKVPSNMHKMRRFRSSSTYAKYNLCSPFIPSVVWSSDSVSMHWRPWADCADEQADLGLHQSCVPKDAWHGPHIFNLSTRASFALSLSWGGYCRPALFTNYPFAGFSTKIGSVVLDWKLAF